MIVDCRATVVVCAYTERRWTDMERAVQRVEAQEMPARLLLVIDHAPELLERARERWPHLDVLENRGPRGLSNARNTGLGEVQTPFVVFLDDDAAPDGPSWLDRLLEPFGEGVAAVGGRAVPMWPEDRTPRMLPSELHWIVGCSYTGQPTVRAEVRNVMGCNMAFRTEALRRIGGFNPDVGRIGRIPRGCEETEACIRIGRGAEPSTILFTPEAVVLHQVTADRTTWRYLRARSFAEGVSKAALSTALGTRDALSNEREYVVRTLPAAVVRELRRINLAGAAAIIAALVLTSTGYVYGRLRGPDVQPVHAAAHKTKPAVE